MALRKGVKLLFLRIVTVMLIFKRNRVELISETVMILISCENSKLEVKVRYKKISRSFLKVSHKALGQSMIKYIIINNDMVHKTNV